MQQQFFTLSPMAGQETFSALEIRPAPNTMAHTPTTSSMLAALQNDPFPAGTMDGSSSGFNPDAYGSMSYMDTNPHEVSYPDYGSSNSFDVGSFTNHDLGLSSQGTPGGGDESDHESAPVKTET